MGLTLHPMDPIDPPASNKTEKPENNHNQSGGLDLTSTLFKGDMVESNSEAGNTSREVQDILGMFSIILKNRFEPNDGRDAFLVMSSAYYDRTFLWSADIFTSV